MQIAARDRTRVGLQSEVHGRDGDLGVRNILCLSGDSMKMAPAPRGRMDIIDIDAIQMLWILRRMRDEGKYLDGREIKTPAASSSWARPPRHSPRSRKFQALREHKKVNAGAQFFQTNLVFDADALEIWLNELAKRNILDKVYILIGITPLKTLKMAKYMNDEVPGVSIPEPLLKRMEAAEKAGNAPGRRRADRAGADREDQEVKGQGVNGLHIMAVGWEEIVPRIVTEAGVLPNRTLCSTSRRHRAREESRLADARLGYPGRDTLAGWEREDAMLPEQIKNFREMVTLKDGTYVLLRPMNSEDEKHLIEFYAAVSDEDMRYFRDGVKDAGTDPRLEQTFGLCKVLPILAFVKDRVVGSATLHFCEGPKRHMAEIRLFLAKDFRRRGLGMKMIEGADRPGARHWGWASCWLKSWQTTDRQGVRNAGFQADGHTG